MRIDSPIGKQVEVVPVSGGVVHEGKVIAITKEFIILTKGGKEHSYELKGMKVTQQDSQILEDIQKELPYHLSETSVSVLTDAIPILRHLWRMT